MLMLIGVNILELELIKERREELCGSFARKYKEMKHLFPPNRKEHTMIPRNSNHFEDTKPPYF